MDKLEIKGYVFGDGTPRIVVPLMGYTEDEIYEHADAIKREIIRLDDMYTDMPQLRVSVIEWRADYFEGVADLDRLTAVLKSLRDTFDDRLILFTFRSEEQGGYLRHDRVGSNLEPVVKQVIISECVDMLDVEVTCGNYKVARATTKAHEFGIKVVMSYHDFERTPHDSEIIEKLKTMEILGGDILKIAVMPRTEFDVRRAMELNARMIMESYKPVCIISMGSLGVTSRYRCDESGSCMTFAMVGQESAPGQMLVEDLIPLLKSHIS